MPRFLPSPKRYRLAPVLLALAFLAYPVCADEPAWVYFLEELRELPDWPATELWRDGDLRLVSFKGPGYSRDDYAEYLYNEYTVVLYADGKAWRVLPSIRSRYGAEIVNRDQLKRWKPEGRFFVPLVAVEFFGPSTKGPNFPEYEMLVLQRSGTGFVLMEISSAGTADGFSGPEWIYARLVDGAPVSSIGVRWTDCCSAYSGLLVWNGSLYVPFGQPYLTRSPTMQATGNLNVRSRPERTAPKIGSLAEGESVLLLGRSEHYDSIDGLEERWFLVETAAGLRGWVYGGYLR